MDTVHSAITEPVRRLEVFTGAGRRRRWSEEDKARIVAEIVASGDSVCAVARRHGLSPQQLFGWRRQLREAAAGHFEAEELQFVPAMADGITPAPARRGRHKARPVDFRRGAEGLATLVREVMTADPFSDTVYVFRARRADQIKLMPTA
jgi:transposase